MSKPFEMGEALKYGKDAIIKHDPTINPPGDKHVKPVDRNGFACYWEPWNGTDRDTVKPKGE